jgi:hypothetical protein
MKPEREVEVSQTSGGWWIAVNTGEVIEVQDHASEVVRSPERFGLSLGDVRGLVPHAVPRDERVRILIEVMKRGWIRIRFARGRKVIETWTTDHRLWRHSVARFLDATGAWDCELVQVNEVSSGKTCLRRVIDLRREAACGGQGRRGQSAAGAQAR